MSLLASRPPRYLIAVCMALATSVSSTAQIIHPIEVRRVDFGRLVRETAGPGSRLSAARAKAMFELGPGGREQTIGQLRDSFLAGELQPQDRWRGRFGDPSIRPLTVAGFELSKHVVDSLSGSGGTLSGWAHPDFAALLRQHHAYAMAFYRELTSRIRLDTVINELEERAGAVRQHQTELTPADLDAELRKIGVQDTASVVQSFNTEVSNPRMYRFTKPTTLLRIAGGTTAADGRFFMCCAWGDGRTQFVDATNLALPPGNTKEVLVQKEIPAGTLAVVGPVADNFGKEFGGNTQVFIPNAFDQPRPTELFAFSLPETLASEPTWFDVLWNRPVSKPKEFIVLLNDRMVRFQLGGIDSRRNAARLKHEWLGLLAPVPREP